MQFPRYRLDPTTLPRIPPGRIPSEELGAIAVAILDVWQPVSEGAAFPSQVVDLCAEITLRTEGASGAEVYDLAFSPRGSSVVARFIVKAHLGHDAAANAVRERSILNRLAATASEWFSAQLVVSPDIPSNVIVYRHAADQLAAEPSPLHATAAELIRTRDAAGLRALGEQLGRLMSGLLRAYDTAYLDVSVSDPERIVAQHAARLVPDLVIDAREREFGRAGAVNIVVTKEGSAPAKALEHAPSDVELLCDSLNGAGLSGRKWLKFILWPERERCKTGLLRFRALGNRYVWLRVDSHVTLDSLSVEGDGAMSFLVNRDDCAPQLGSQALDSLGLEPTAVVTSDVILGAISSDTKLSRRFRHTDLHAANVLWGEGRLKIIDLISSDLDLPSVCSARLEVSLWHTLADNLDMSTEDVEVVLEAVAKRQHLELGDKGWNAWVATTLLVPVRSAAGSDMLSGPLEEALAYTLQVSLHQRYLLEKEDPPSLHFAVLAAYWLNALNGLAKSPALVTEAGDVNSNTTEPEASLGLLWTSALSEPGEPPNARAVRLLDAMRVEKPALWSARLTDLQREVLARHESVAVFGGHSHVIISGPTGSGKSTVAEMFLARPSVINENRLLSLYIAPTRALARAKYRDLISIFARDSALKAGCVLSTGEDTDHDWRIAHGRFLIACMVYEKANIVFSRARDLVGRLGCVVVDEMHMLADLERGPILEVVLTKLVRSRNQQESRASRAPELEQLQVVVISTEGAADEAFRKFLSASDGEGGNHRPMLVQATQRPIPVAHNLVLPGREGESYALYRFAEFDSNDARSISKERLREIDKELDAIRTKSDAASLASGAARERRQDERARAIDLVVDLFRQRPRGCRILVFVPGRSMAEELAKNCKNRLSELGRTFELPAVDPTIWQAIRPLLDDSEDSSLSDTIRACATSGVFIHHADVDRQVREKLEATWALPLSTYRSEVVFATETLSYGVNLGINDVVILGTKFRSQSRMREPEKTALSTCALHNMTGRAGRLGHVSQNPGVYIIVAADENPSASIRRYYSGATPVESRLFVKDDKQAQLAIDGDRFAVRVDENHEDPCDKYKNLGPTQFSYPFVRSALDALRHLNLELAPRGSTSIRTPVSREQVLKFFNDSFYAYQVLVAPGGSERREAVLFSCAVARTLDGCAAPPLHLVHASGLEPTVFAITDRGEAIIDTGTELSTVEPLLRLVTSIRSLWSSDPMPVEVFILCLLGQAEIFRKCIRYAPECRKSDKRGWTKEVAARNREHVLQDCELALSKIGEPQSDAKARALRKILDAWEPLQVVDAAYTNGASDSLLRFFAAAVSWVRGEKQSEVFEQVERVVGTSEYRGRLEGWRQLTEILSWKARFLAKMLVTARAEAVPYSSEDERQVLSLASRLRLGCTSEAVPLFWPQSSNISRRDAVAVLETGMTPGRIVSVAEPQRTLERAVRMKPTRLDALRSDLERYAVKEFGELQEEMTLESERRSGDSRSRALLHLWKETREMFEKSVFGFRRDRPEAIEYDNLLRYSLDPARLEADGEAPRRTSSSRQSNLDSAYRLRVDVNDDELGVVLSGAGGTRSKRRQSVRVVGVQMRRDWTCHVRNGRWKSLADLLVELRTTKNLVLVPMPWTPYHGEIPSDVVAVLSARQAESDSTCVMATPAALSVMITAMLRNFTDGEDVMTLLTSKHAFGLGYLSLVATNRRLQAGSVSWPESIRERIVSCFEVDPTVSEAMV